MTFSLVWCVCEFTFAMVDIVVWKGFVAVNGATGNGFGGDNGSTFADDDDGGGGGTTSVGVDTCCETVFGGCNFPFSNTFFGKPNSF